MFLTQGQNTKKDQRPHAQRPEPKNKLTEEERQDVIEIVKKEEFVDLPPSQIVPKLADQVDLHCFRINNLPYITRRKNATTPWSK